jgi:6,7-dimethyl-8-ribityllumazine synthase
VKVMAGEYVGAVTSDPSWKYGVVVARFNSLVTKQLLEGAHEVFHRHGVKPENVDVSHAAWAWVHGGVHG